MNDLIKKMGTLCLVLGCACNMNAMNVEDDTLKEERDTLVVLLKCENGGDLVGRKCRQFGRSAVEGGSVNAGSKQLQGSFFETLGTNVNYKREYRGNVELSCAIPDSWGITTSHGFSFGNGLYVGGGAGFVAEFLPDYESLPTYLVPVFADVKYSFIDRVASPLLNIQTGVYADITNTGVRYFLNPSVGIDVGRFAFKVGYEYQMGVWRHNHNVSKHNAKIAVSFTF